MMGGMGGMGGGGMGGGMFAVPDQPTKTVSTPAAASDDPVADAKAILAELDNLTEDAVNRSAIERKLTELVKAELFQAQKDLVDDKKTDAKKRFESIIDVVGNAMREGHPLPWMYEALSLSMQACDYPEEEIYRVLMSSVDFSGSLDEAMKVAKYLIARDMNEQALVILEDIHHAAPALSQPLEIALALAMQTENYNAMRWSAAGVLSQGWTDDKLPLIEKARLATRMVFVKLTQESRVMEATALKNEIENALRRDVVVRVTWTGDADVDISVEEPAGSICSVNNPRTIGGGMLLSDGNSLKDPGTEGYSETYVCPHGFSGRYRVLVSKAWGEVTAGKVTVEVMTDYGSENERYVKQLVPVGEKSSLIELEVVEGHRKEEILDATLTRIDTERMRLATSVLAQSAYSSGETYNGESSSGDANTTNNPNQGFQNNGFFGRRPGLAGYMPNISQIPEGAFMTVSAVISGDRRYVRMTPAPNFSNIIEVQTFNFITGEGGTDGGGGGLGGGGGFGGGGAGGGAF
jgi:hypothetical protein